MDMSVSIMNLKGMAGRMAGSLKGGGAHTALIMESLRKVADREPGERFAAWVARADEAVLR